MAIASEDKPADKPAELVKPLPPPPTGYVRAVVLKSFPAAVESEAIDSPNHELKFASKSNRMISQHRYDTGEMRLPPGTELKKGDVVIDKPGDPMHGTVIRQTHKKGKYICQNVILLSHARFAELSAEIMNKKRSVKMRDPLVRAFVEGPDNYLLTTQTAPDLDRQGRLLSSLPPRPADEIARLSAEVASLKAQISGQAVKK